MDFWWRMTWPRLLKVKLREMEQGTFVAKGDKAGEMVSPMTWVWWRMVGLVAFMVYLKTYLRFMWVWTKNGSFSDLQRLVVGSFTGGWNPCSLRGVAVDPTKKIPELKQPPHLCWLLLVTTIYHRWLINIMMYPALHQLVVDQHKVLAASWICKSQLV